MKVKIYAVPIYVKLYFLAERQAKVVGKSKVAMLEDAVATLSITLLWIFRLPIRGGICPLFMTVMPDVISASPNFQLFDSDSNFSIR